MLQQIDLQLPTPQSRRARVLRQLEHIIHITQRIQQRAPPPLIVHLFKIIQYILQLARLRERLRLLALLFEVFCLLCCGYFGRGGDCRRPLARRWYCLRACGGRYARCAGCTWYRRRTIARARREASLRRGGPYELWLYLGSFVCGGVYLERPARST